MPHELDNPVVVEFPLRGEGWMAVTTPATRVPSHGVDMLGQRYAYDLLKVDERKGVHFHPAGSVRGLVIGGRTRECYAWGASIHAPFDGEVVRASDGMPEREWIHPDSREAALVMIRNGLTFTPSPDPVDPRQSRPDPAGRRLRRLRSPRPRHARGRRGPARDQRRDHRPRRPHRQLDVAPPPLPADGLADLMTARGVACAFRAYEVERDGRVGEGDERDPRPSRPDQVDRTRLTAGHAI